MERKCIMLLLSLFCYISAQSSPCIKSSGIIYTRSENEVVLPFRDDIQTGFASYKIYAPGNISLMTVSLFSGVLNKIDGCSDCLIGNVSAFNFTIRLNQTYNGGDFWLTRGSETIDCLTVYILGVPKISNITVEGLPFESWNVKLICNGVSKTKPIGHNISLIYNWMVGGVHNPNGPKYTYDSSRRTLMINGLSRDDANKQISCTATENITGGYTSAWSNILIAVNYGPDNVIISPSNTIYSVDENTRLENINCSADCSPDCTYKWSKFGQQEPVTNTGILPLGFIMRNYTGTYTCTARSSVLTTKYMELVVNISVKYGPDNSIRLLPKQTLYTVNETGDFIPNITCLSDCFPECTFSWTKNRNGVETTVASGDVLSIGIPNRENGATYTCKTTNPERGTAVTIDVNIYVRYGPDAAVLNVPSTYIITEGMPDGNLTCTSDCYPPCTNQLSNKSVLVGSGGVFLFGKATRYHAGIYNCTATNIAPGYNKSQQQFTNVTVYYPPDITIKTTNSSVGESFARLECVARGVPSSINNYGKWIHVWPGYGTIYESEGSAQLDIIKPTYEHSGNYTCSASNGVKLYGTNTEYMEGSVFLLVKSFPVVTYPKEKTHVPAKLDNFARLMIEYYSNVDMTKIECFKASNISQQAKKDCIVNRSSKTVHLPVLSKVVPTSGEEATISIRIDKEEDFGIYSVVLTNAFNFTVFMVDIKPEGPPLPPKEIVIDRIGQTMVRLSWSPGFNGGFPQTFVIQKHTDTADWHNLTFVKEAFNTTTLDGLLHSTNYLFRMYSFNEKGRSNYTETYNFTTLVQEKIDNEVPSAALIGGAAGGSVAIIVIVVAVILVIVIKRREVMKQGSSKSSGSDDRKTVINEENEYGMKDNPMYVSAGPEDNEHRAEGTGPLYSAVTKTPAAANSNNYIYADVDRTKRKNVTEGIGIKKTKKTEKDKKAANKFIEGDVYENAPNSAVNKGSSCCTDKETIYENPENREMKDKKKMNKDGLIYADLEFNNQPKGQKKLVIRGLDNMTEYSFVDFSKKADPLPDSDNENDSPK